MFPCSARRLLTTGFAWIATVALLLPSLPAQAASPDGLPLLKRIQVQRFQQHGRMERREHREREERRRELRKLAKRLKASGQSAMRFRTERANRDQLAEAAPVWSPADDVGRRTSPARALGADTPPVNRLVNNRAGDGATSGQCEVSIAAHGNNLMAAWNDGQGFITNGDGQGYAYSTDGGSTWTDGGDLPHPGGFPNWQWTSDPVITVNEKTGAFYYTGLCDPSAGFSGIGVVKGTFVGANLNFGTPTLVRTVNASTDFLDKQWMAADSSSGRLYLTHTRFFGATGAEIAVQVSNDDNATWSTPITVSTPGENGIVQGSRPIVAGDGTATVMYYLIGPIDVDFYRVSRSTNGGTSWSSPVTAVSFFANFMSGAPGFNRAQGITFSGLAVDRSSGPRRGRVYLSWAESVNFYDDFSNWGSLGAISETESNNSAATANPATVGQRLRGSIAAGDLDYYALTLNAGQTIAALMDTSAGTNTLRMFASDGTTRLAFTTVVANDQGFIIYTAPVTGTYYLRVAQSSSTGNYSVATGNVTRTTERSRDSRDIFTTWSDNGTTWSTPVRISDSAPGYDDWLPEIAVSSEGRAYCAWYDWRDAAPLTRGGESNIYLARSDDGGSTWINLGPTTDATTDWTNVTSNIQPNQGDYMSLWANDVGVYPCWSDGRAISAVKDPNVFMAVWPLALTPTQIALVSASAEPGVARLAWFADVPASFTADVERSIGIDGAWSVVATIAVDGSGHLRYEDRDVRAGDHVRYRLAITENGTRRTFAPTALDIPSGLSFALDGLHPNPSDGPAWVTFSLPASAPATLRVHDVTGRVVRSIDAGELGAGRHVLRLDDAGRLAPGVYLVTLTQQGRTLRTNLNLLR